MTSSNDALHRPAAFINAIADEGTKAEAVEWLQKTWNELCQAEDELRALRAAPPSSDARAEEDTKRIASLQREVGAKQAQIDRLMLEYCPEDMTPEQIENWKRHQKAVSPEQEAAAEYARKNPLGGPATMFEAMASRIRAGEDYHAVLSDYDLCVRNDSEGIDWKARAEYYLSQLERQRADYIALSETAQPPAIPASVADKLERQHCGAYDSQPLAAPSVNKESK